MNEHARINNLEYVIRDLVAQHPELDEDEDLRADMLEGSTDLHAVLTRLVAKANEAGAFVSALKGQMSQLAERKKRYERRQEAFRAMMHRLMEAARTRKMELPEATLSIRAVAPQCVITDEAAIPEDFLKIVATPDKAAIREALKEGKTVPGAHMSNGSETLSVRVS